MCWWWYTTHMRQIHAKEAILITIVIVIAIVIAITTSSKHLKDYSLSTTNIATSTQHSAIKLSSFSHSYARGEYTFDGSITTPTTCYVASVKTSLVPSTTPQVIHLNVTVPIDTGRCLQLQATTTFSASQHALKSAIVRVYVNNLLATSTKL